MCGRFVSLHPDWDHWQTLGITKNPDHPMPVFCANVAPSESISVIGRHSRSDLLAVKPMPWGIKPPWPKAPWLINIRLESTREKPWFKSLWRRQRCLVPMRGFYEWQRHDQGNIPFLIHTKEPLTVAGLWFRAEDPSKAPFQVALVTQEAPRWFNWLHHRFPLVIAPSNRLSFLRDGLWDTNASDSLDLQDSGDFLCREMTTALNHSREKRSEVLFDGQSIEEVFGTKLRKNQNPCDGIGPPPR
jgi:putative SOS response-associated peptidase YedK